MLNDFILMPLYAIRNIFLLDLFLCGLFANLYKLETVQQIIWDNYGYL